MGFVKEVSCMVERRDILPKRGVCVNEARCIRSGDNSYNIGERIYIYLKYQKKLNGFAKNSPNCRERTTKDWMTCCAKLCWWQGRPERHALPANCCLDTRDRVNHLLAAQSNAYNRVNRREENEINK